MTLWPKPLSKFIYSEKATKFCEISTVDLSYVVPVKFMVEIPQNYVVFSEYINFTKRYLVFSYAMHTMAARR